MPAGFDGQMPHALPMAQAPSVPPSLQSVLIVDDNAAVTHALGALIRKAGFETIPCHTGNDALTYCTGERPDAAVIDIHLPDLNGLILARSLREQLGPSVPIIVVSGDTSMETINSLPHVGATYFFSKPVNPAALMEQLKELVGSNASAKH